MKNSLSAIGLVALVICAGVLSWLLASGAPAYSVGMVALALGVLAGSTYRRWLLSREMGDDSVDLLARGTVVVLVDASLAETEDEHFVHPDVPQYVPADRAETLNVRAVEDAEFRLPWVEDL